MAKRRNGGVSPKKVNRDTGSTSFNVELMTEDDLPKSFKVFGNANHCRALEFKENKSPVKMKHPTFYAA